MNRSIPESFCACLLLVLSAPAQPPAKSVKFVKVTSKPIARTTELPGEFYPSLSVELRARVAGYVDKVLVDRGSFVRQGDLLIQLSAPEMMARIAQARAQATAAESEQAQAQAQLAAAQSKFSRLQEAAKTPGAVAENDLIQAKQETEAAEALLRSRQKSVDSQRSNLKSQEELAGYLRVTAPFDGVITTRYVHPGALAGPGSDAPLLQLDQISHLRLAVAVPEEDVAGVTKGRVVEFRVPAYPDRTFSGVIARPAHALDVKTRTMPVELDVRNPNRLLAPGMYSSVLWPIRSKARLIVPQSSVVTTTERVFVIRNRNGRAEWVNVRKGPSAGTQMEVESDGLKPGDEVVERATDEIREGSRL